MKQVARIGILAAVFATGYLAGTMNQPTAEAQLGDALKAAGGAAADSAVGDASDAAGSAGSLAEIGQLGSAITDMQGNVDALQKNLKLLSTIQSALGG